MKTDKFDDAIRRKLESIDPPFRERDWSHMQAFMHHHGFPPAWVGASQWLMPLAAAAAITGLIISTVWQFGTNQQLSQSVQLLSRTVTRLETTQAKLIKLETQTDTVYVTNFTKNPASANPNQPVFDQPTQRERSAARVADQYALQPASPITGTRQPAGSAATQPTKPRATRPIIDPMLSSSQQTQPDRLAQPQWPVAAASDVSAPDAPAQRPATGNESGLTSLPLEPDRAVTRTADRPNRADATEPTKTPSDRSQREGRLRTPPAPASQLIDNQNYTTSQPRSGRNGSRLSGNDMTTTTGVADNQSETRQISSVALAHMRPLPVDSAYYVERIASRTRRIRSLLPAATTVLPTASAPADVASRRPVTGFRVRLGVSGEVSSAQRALGVYSEVLIGQHWSIGVGLNQLSRQGGHFATDEQFNRMTHNDFRQLYAPGPGPIRDITDINRQFTVWQLPVNLIYRALLGKGFALTPSVGMDVSLSAQDNTTFTYRRGIFEYPNRSSKPRDRSCTSFNTYTVALGAEKSWKHLVLQVGPLLALPAKATPDPAISAVVSLRARVLFQF